MEQFTEQNLKSNYNKWVLCKRSCPFKTNRFFAVVGVLANNTNDQNPSIKHLLFDEIFVSFNLATHSALVVDEEANNGKKEVVQFAGNYSTL
ncbi:MAG: hypothetical protein WCR52_21825 [Bacteroidota bacterium]